MLTFMENWRINNSIKKRGITHFIHFTNLENIESILCYGLLTRSFMDKSNITYSYNDLYRYDNLDNSVSLSIMFPNYKMFYKIRRENQNARWGVILLKAIEIIKLNCVFCRTNAANSEVSRIPVSQRKGYSAFEDMFYERNDISRAEMGLPSCFSTDPQAEILVCDNIPPKCIEYICVEKEIDMEFLKSKGINACVNDVYFAPRCDYLRW